MFDPCVVAKTELDALTQWSQARDRLQRWMWAQGCPQVDPPSNSPTAGNWAVEWPPTSFTIPGNPDNRVPPGW